MSRPEKNPHLDMPTEEQLVEVLAETPDALRKLYLETHRLMLETLPDVKYSVDLKDGMTGYGARQYGYDGWGMAALSAHKSWVRLVFMQGAHLPDPTALLEGTGKNLRHVKIRSAEQFTERRAALRALIEAAAQANGAAQG